MRIIPEILFFVLLSAAVTAERVDTLQEVLDRQQKGLGEPLQSVQIDLAITEPTFSVTARYLAKRDSQMRIDVYADGQRVFSEGLAADGGWQWHGDSATPEALSVDGAAALRRGIVGNLYTLSERRKLGYKLQYEGRQSVDGIPYWKVSSVAPDGFRETFFINVRSGLIERKVESSALHPDIDATPVQSITVFSDFRVINNRTLSFAMEKRDAESGELLVEVAVTGAEVNPELPEAAFIPALN